MPTLSYGGIRSLLMGKSGRVLLCDLYNPLGVHVRKYAIIFLR
jgi:hypothetical protein